MPTEAKAGDTVRVDFALRSASNGRASATVTIHEFDADGESFSATNGYRYKTSDIVCGTPPVPVAVPKDGLFEGYDAEFWHGSYRILCEAVDRSFPQFLFEDDVAEEAIYEQAIELAGGAIPVSGESVILSRAEIQEQRDFLSEKRDEGESDLRYALAIFDKWLARSSEAEQ